MGAFFSNIGAWILKKVVVAFLEWAHGKFKRHKEREQAITEQAKKDEANKPKYEQAVKHGSHQEIEQATEDLLNGR